MADPALLSIHDAYVTFGRKPLFETLCVHIHPRERICLVGRNGAGKSTLMQLITGQRELDGGRRWVEPGIRIGYLAQEIKPEPGQNALDFILSGLPKEKQDEEHRYLAEMMLEPFELEGEARVEKLSGGQMRRASLARALVEEPDILLLDEPTNHLDLAAIEWLESYLQMYRGALLCVSHDKAFLKAISNKVFWLDRGQVRVCPQGFSHFEEWSEMLLEQEARELQRRERILAGELEWANRGVKARRKRNMRRVHDIRAAREKLKADKSLFRQTMNRIELEPLSANLQTKVVAEFIKVGKSYPLHERSAVSGSEATADRPGASGATKKILDGFSLRIMQGDRIGVLGKNGSGKTTFLRMLVGEETPDAGKVKQAKNLQISYFDQKRRDLKDNFTLRKTLNPDGGDYVNVMGKPRHVCGYLKDFLFDPKGAGDLVGTLSGGQKNRLLLAKVLANPGGLLILDEPTNDLDMDTLEMLEDILSKYEGTLIVVSHDRDFLDQTVTKVLAFEGDAQVEGHIGGYSDYLEKKQESGFGGQGSGKNKENKKRKEVRSGERASPEPSPIAEGRSPEQGQLKKLSYKLRYELDNLPGKIAAMEKELAQLQETLADSTFYMRDPEGFDKTTRRYGRLKDDLARAEDRWLELSGLQEGS